MRLYRIESMFSSSTAYSLEVEMPTEGKGYYGLYPCRKGKEVSKW